MKNYSKLKQAKKEIHILFTIRLNYSESILQGYLKVFFPTLHSLHLFFSVSLGIDTIYTFLKTVQKTWAWETSIDLSTNYMFSHKYEKTLLLDHFSLCQNALILSLKKRNKTHFLRKMNQVMQLQPHNSECKHSKFCFHLSS